MAPGSVLTSLAVSEVVCPQCGNLCVESHKFCPVCGFPIHEFFQKSSDDPLIGKSVALYFEKPADAEKPTRSEVLSETAIG